MKQPKILLTGATGRTGSAVVDELLAKVPVRALVHSDVLQELGIGLLRLKDDVSSAAAGDLQVAALRSRGHSVCRPLVSSILPFVS